MKETTSNMRRLQDLGKEKLYIWIAWHLPRSIVYWCTVRLGAEVSTADELVHIEVPSLTFSDALRVWRKYS